ncbi:MULTISPECIES: hypothetical protein [Pseudomonas]|jgi:hypothetical protein|uniref:hypothetical protein n=1 Tax=Pseudomonas TaxID=286 RepID=UPI001AE9C1FA|nr:MULTISPECIES: hypothetical protein [unclassified Pseudomonas]MBP1127636.1 hypothetical protein [Pseudomonas sp. PvP025]MDQ0396574.1 hypothetical protein [Pseudomonas sp. PvP006]MEB0108511.1 hypothetical protein [Pseudomonas sp. MH9.3]WPX78509.1 hypothetical protein RHM60_20030 [Pseudomonas sp. MH9.3]
MFITPSAFTTSEKITTRSDTPALNDRASDINFFLSEIHQTDKIDKRTVHAVASSDSTWAATGSTTIARQLSKGFRDASQNKQTTDASKFPQLLAESQVNVMSQIKVVGAIAKACDKISSMG